MKYLLIALFLFLSACTQTERVARTYPGKQDNSQQCRSAWNLGYTFDIQKCEANTENPKFKIGQKVKIIKGYDSSCVGLVLSLFFYNTTDNENTYRVRVTCDGVEVRSMDEISEKYLQ